mgnify:CR=1 FL=1
MELESTKDGSKLPEGSDIERTSGVVAQALSREAEGERPSWPGVQQSEQWERSFLRWSEGAEEGPPSHGRLSSRTDQHPRPIPFATHSYSSHLGKRPRSRVPSSSFERSTAPPPAVLRLRLHNRTPRYCAVAHGMDTDPPGSSRRSIAKIGPWYGLDSKIQRKNSPTARNAPGSFSELARPYATASSWAPVDGPRRAPATSRLHRAGQLEGSCTRAGGA